MALTLKHKLRGTEWHAMNTFPWVPNSLPTRITRPERSLELPDCSTASTSETRLDCRVAVETLAPPDADSGWHGRVVLLLA